MSSSSRAGRAPGNPRRRLPLVKPSGQSGNAGQGYVSFKERFCIPGYKDPEVMLIRGFSFIALTVVCCIAPTCPVIAQSIQFIEPCLVKTMPHLGTLPANTPIIQVAGHEFRKSDGCSPVFVTFTWENQYDRGDGCTQYSLKFVHTFPGEFWYRTDREEFAIAAASQWKGLNLVREFKGFGQKCVKYEDGVCTACEKFDYGHVHPVKTVWAYIAELTYGYPEVTRGDETVPVTFNAVSPDFRFDNGLYQWMPVPLHINNAGLASFDYRKIVKEASGQGIYAIKVEYDQDNDVEDVPSGHKGSLLIRLDFDERCGGNNQSDMDPCQQIEELLTTELRWALNLRDIYEGAKERARDVNHIKELVNEEIRERYPHLDSNQMTWMLDNMGTTNLQTLEISVPEFCDECAAYPLCRWKREIIELHENTHKMNLEENNQWKLLLTDTPYQYERYPRANERNIAIAKVYADMEVIAYNERAKFIVDLINKELGSAPGCTFDFKFWSDFDAMVNTIQ